MTEGSATSKLYFDANVFIYAVEGSDDIACARMLSFDRALKLPKGMHRVTRDGLPWLIEELS